MSKATVPATTDFEMPSELVSVFKQINETDRHLFITGKAGTGKSTFLQQVRRLTGKNLVLLAPTGVAALNIKGQTIHSFFTFKPDVTVDSVTSIRCSKAMHKVYRNLQTIVIDEVSMVRADLLDAIDAFLRQNGPRSDKPFGGVQMILCGDLYQLSPVVTKNEMSLFHSIYESPYFFDAKSFKNIEIDFIEFDQSYRQTDPDFLSLLNAIRTNAITSDDLERINERCRPDFEPGSGDYYIYLTTTNKLADAINDQKLNGIYEDLVTVEGEMTGWFTGGRRIS